MKIAYIITRSDEIGGAHIHVRDIANWMKGRGHDVHVYVGGNGIYCQLLSDANVPFTQLRNLTRPISLIKDAQAIFELKSLLKSYNPDLVSIHSAKAGLIARIACKLLKKKCIFTAHGWSFADGVKFPMRSIYKILERVLARFSNNIITVCETDRQLALASKVSSSDKINTVHNGMPEIDRALVAKPINTPAKLIMIARFESQKDHFSLIKALGQLKHLSWTIDLIGEGGLQQDIMNLVKELNLSDRVNFLGRRWDIPELLSKADIFVLITFWEGFPRSIIEAMRGGLPVLATNVAGIPEAVIDGKTGFLVEPSDVSMIAQKLEYLIQNPDDRSRMSTTARLNYLSNFTFEKMAEKTLSIYKSTIK